MKKTWLISLLLVAALLLTSVPALAAAPSNSHKPTNATNVEIIKKVTLKGKGGRGGKPVSGAATGTLGTQLASDATKYAIIIGINEYPSSSLNYCVADAETVYTVLNTVYGYQERTEANGGNTIILEDAQATRDSILTAIDTIRGKVADLGTSAGNAEVFFYFSGHGAKGKADDDDTYKVDQAIVVNNNEGTGFDFIWDGNLVDAFKDFPTSRVIFGFDSCLAGGMSVLQASGRVVNMACSANGLSYEDSSWGHGQFTYYFVQEGMEKGLAGKYDYNGDEVLYQPNDVTVEEAFDYAKASCQFQTPTIADGFTNDLLP